MNSNFYKYLVKNTTNRTTMLKKQKQQSNPLNRYNKNLKRLYDTDHEKNKHYKKNEFKENTLTENESKVDPNLKT
jgi:hypothetical protein